MLIGGPKSSRSSFLTTLIRMTAHWGETERFIRDLGRIADNPGELADCKV
jgi:uncharacterized protein YjiS (DUF1127 family)